MASTSNQLSKPKHWLDGFKDVVTLHKFTSTSNSSTDHAKTSYDLAVKAAEETKRSFRSSLPPSSSFPDNTRDIAQFQREEVKLGSRLGSGTFSDVYVLQSFMMLPQEDETSSIDQAEHRLYMKRHERYRQTGKARYAVKVSSVLEDDRHLFHSKLWSHHTNIPFIPLQSTYMDISLL